MDGSSGLPAGELPIQAIAERFDIIVDFSKFAPGDKLYLVNMLEHKGGRRPEDPISLSAILSESYKGVPTDTDSDGKPDRYEGGDPVVGRFLEFRVHELPAGEVDLSMNPEDYEPGGLVMLEQPTFTQEELSSARRREFEFGRSSGTDEAPWTVKNQDGAFTADPRRITSAPEMGEVEIWTLRNNSGGWSHPVHVHFEEAKILSRNGSTPPLWERYGRKDVFRIGPEQHGGDHVVLAYRFREFAGSYVEHCHNTTHEDTAMLMRWDVEFPGQFKLMPSPLPRWSGVEYVDSFGLEHFRIGDNNVPKGQSGGSGGSGGGAGTHQPPVAEPDAAQVFAGQSIDIAVTQNDIAFGGALIVPDSVSIVTPPASGTAAVSPTGVVTFLAAASADSSLQTFTYTVMDSVGETSNAATVFVQVAGVPGGGGGNGGGNQPPLANGDFGTVLLGGSVTLDILANDQAVAPATLDETSVALVNPPTVGSVSLDGQGHLTYTAPGTAGVTSVQLGYTVADSNGLVSNVAAVTISLQDPGGNGGGGNGGGGNGGGGNNGGGGSGGHGHGEAPRAVYDAATVAVGGSVDILVVANDTDEDGDLDPDTVLIGQSPGQGTVEILGNGWVRYTPSVSSQSSDAFSYSVADEAGLRSNQATVGVSITGGGGSGSGSAPIANYDSALAVSGTTVVIQLLANDTDADGDLDPDSVVITQYPAHGTVTLHSDGTAHYTTFLGYDSSDTFNYTVSDQAGHVSNIATVGVTIDDGQ
jgi:hypothetical protein